MQPDLLAPLAILIVMALALRLTIKIHRAANAARDARSAAAKASADTLMRAYGLSKNPESPDPAAEHIQRLARMRASQRPPKAPPLPARNPGPGLRPHPVHGHRRAAPAPAYAIQPATEPAALASISTDASPDRIDAAVIHSMTLPIGSAEQSGEFPGAGASGSWSSDTSSDTSSSASSSTSTSGD